MNYIFLVAGRGSRLHPITTTYPKTLYRLDEHTTVFERMIQLIRKYDQEANIIAVTGFLHKQIEQVKGVTYVYNPFYEVTNSIASLWMAKEHLTGDAVLINGDIVAEESLVKEVICKTVSRTEVLLDSSVKKNGDYNVQVDGDKVVVMSKELDEYCGEYAGVTRISSENMSQYKVELDKMVEEGLYTSWHEDVLVNMIFRENFHLYYEDISRYSWTEIDCVSDLVLAKKIQNKKHES